MPVWWCYTGLGEVLEDLEMVARDIIGGTQTAFDGEGLAQDGPGRKRGWWAAGLEGGDSGLGGDQLSLEHPLLPSLAVHPDGIRVASGQTAGVDKDGKVRPDRWGLLLSSTLTHSSSSAAPAAGGPHLGLRDTAEAAGDRTGCL